MNVALELHRTTPRKATWDELTQTIEELFDLVDSSETQEELNAAEAELERAITEEFAGKVDGTVFFDKHADAKIALLQDAGKSIAAATGQWRSRKERWRSIVRRSMMRLGASKFKGDIFQIYLTAGRESLNVSEPEAVPAKYKTITLKFPLDAWQTICQIDPMLTALQEWPGTVTVDGAAVKDALKRGEHVPGACLETGEPVLTVRG